MQLLSFRINNYKSFNNSGDIQVDSGFNVIVGQNDAGKTSLLEALSFRFTSNYHRSLKALPRRTSPRDSLSEVVATFLISKEEIYGAAVRAYGLSVPYGDTEDPKLAHAVATAFIKSIEDEGNQFELKYRSDGHIEAVFNGIPAMPRSSLYQHVSVLGGNFSVNDNYRTSDQPKSYPYAITEYLRSRIYSFKAERVKAGQAPFGHSTVLDADIKNLPEVLNSLQGLPPLRDKLNEYIREIFPHVDHVSVRPVDQHGDIRVLIWPHGIGARDDLAIPLSESGTGIGQVLAMLYVVLAAEQPQIFLIDEPQSFLHPGAARKLIEILRIHAQHQFIVSTHSPEIISAAEPRRIVLVQKVGSESRVETIDGKKQQFLTLMLRELGIRLSDVFGADRVLWVEGKTEELCFPLILKYHSVPLRGTAILAVSSTGDFDRRRASLAIDVYQRLSNGAGLLPPAVGFVFDADSRTDEARVRFKKESQNLAEFLPRRMYECYLLNPMAIATVLTRSVGREISTEAIQAWLDLNKADGKYYPRGSGRTADGRADWLQNIDGANFLSDMFQELSNNTAEFQKTTHSVRLTEYLLENKPEALNEVRDLLVELLTRNQDSDK
jgi:predicted ATPase